MLMKCLKGLMGAAALSLLGACSTPMTPMTACGADGRLCAPAQPNTSATAHPRAADLARTAPAPGAAPVPQAEVQTMPVDAPGSQAAVKPAARGVRVGLILPLRSEALGPPADALRAGFMAAHERDRDGIVVNLIETGDGPTDTLDAYRGAIDANDIVVGPLARPAVSALASSGMVTKPTIALNHPDAREARLPGQMLVIGLSIEDEARQVAQWAAAEHPAARALIVSGPTNWQRRIATAFAAQWKQQGLQAQTVEIAATNGYLSEAGINQLKDRIEIEPPTLLFTALDADQVRQVRGMLGPELLVYGTSSINPGTEPGAATAELEGMRLLDMPWQVQPDHPAVMVYPRWTGTRRTLDLDRLYALGIDAYRVARELALRPGTSFKMDGVTGRLAVDVGAGGSRFERVQPRAVYEAGAFKPVTSPR